jgi:hypothetical protein
MESGYYWYKPYHEIDVIYERTPSEIRIEEPQPVEVFYCTDEYNFMVSLMGHSEPVKRDLFLGDFIGPIEPPEVKTDPFADIEAELKFEEINKVSYWESDIKVTCFYGTATWKYFVEQIDELKCFREHGFYVKSIDYPISATKLTESIVMLSFKGQDYQDKFISSCLAVSN